jgi:hypothetical protein
MAGNKAHGAAKKCGAKRKSGGKCNQAAGWGTDHPGSGKCKLHGGASTGPKTKKGKAAVSQNARVHGGYIDKILNDQERQLYEYLWTSTMERYKLDEENGIYMATLHRACMSYVKLVRMDEWEMEEIFEPWNEVVNMEGQVKGLVPRPQYDHEGNKIGETKGVVRRIRWARNAPNWEQHFQQYIKLLGVDRGSEIKAKQDQKQAQAVVDGFAWLWGQKSKEED